MDVLEENAINYKETASACYVGNLVQAIVNNITGILFVPLKTLYGLSYFELGSLVMLNFVIQVVINTVLSGLADKYGFRILVVLGQGLAVTGLLLFAASPFFYHAPYIGLLIGTACFSVGAGIMEMNLSPIVDSIPTPVKATAMSVLHSFYAWGQLIVIIVTTVLLQVLESTSWPVIVDVWAIVPAINLILFLKVPIPQRVPEEKRMKTREFAKNKYFVMCAIAIAVGGASELVVASWAPAFIETGLGLPRIWGNLLGVALFALMLAIGRTIFGKRGKNMNLHQVMIVGSLVAGICYVGLSLSPFIALSLIACAACGIAVSLLWPGTLVIGSETFPRAGSSMFALLAASGNVGASFGPWIVGIVSDASASNPGLANLATSLGITQEQLGLRIGMLIGVIFPILCLAFHVWLKKNKEKSRIV